MRAAAQAPARTSRALAMAPCRYKRACASVTPACRRAPLRRARSARAQRACARAARKRVRRDGEAATRARAGARAGAERNTEKKCCAAAAYVQYARENAAKRDIIRPNYAKQFRELKSHYIDPDNVNQRTMVAELQVAAAVKNHKVRL